MRALLLPLALAACTPAAGGQDEDVMASINAAEAAADALEDAMENAADALDANLTGAPLSPAWLADGSWVYAGEEVTGAVWYFEAMASDFTVRPHRVLLRTDEHFDPDSVHSDTARLAEIDCARHLYRILRTTHHDEAGRASEADESGDGRMVPVAPGSVFAQVEESACRHAADPGGTSVMNGM